MASSSDRFSLKTVSLSGRTTIAPTQRIPTPSTGQYYASLHKGVLYLEDSSIYQGGRFFEASGEPTEATSFGLSALMMVRLEKDKETPRYLIIKRSHKLSTFPGMLSVPGGYHSTSDCTLVRTAFRELTEETTLPKVHSKHTWMGRGTMGIAGTLFAVIDSVPTPSRHNITCVYTIGFTLNADETFASILTKMHPQEGEVDEILLLTLDELKARSAECTPGFAKMFPFLQEGEHDLTWIKQ